MTQLESHFPVGLFSYNPETGSVVRLVTRSGRPQEAGSENGEGYLLVQGHGIRVLVHRLAWRLQTGQWPTGEIDHINRNRRDNRWCNLRAATSAENKHNRGAQRNNTSGEKGVFFDRSALRWKVACSVSGIRFQAYAIHKLSAILAARLIRRTLHGEFAA